MNEYYSRHFQTIDEKGRIVLPGKLRRIAEADSITEETKIRFYMRYFDGGLSLFTERAWRPLVQHYLAYSNLDQKERKKKRRFFMAVEDVWCDRQGRITIPQYWRERAGLNGNIVIIGVGDHIEIWSEERFESLDDDLNTEDGVSEEVEKDSLDV